MYREQVLGSKGEYVLYIVARLGRGLEEGIDFVRFLEFDGPRLCHLSVLFKVGLIADQVQQDVWVRMLFCLFQPVDHVEESVVPRDVVCQEDAVGASVEYTGDGPETLLSCRVPYLELDNLILDFDNEGAELHAYGHVVLLLEFVVHDP